MKKGYRGTLIGTALRYCSTAKGTPGAEARADDVEQEGAIHKRQAYQCRAITHCSFIAFHTDEHRWRTFRACVRSNTHRASDGGTDFVYPLTVSYANNANYAPAMTNWLARPAVHGSYRTRPAPWSTSFSPRSRSGTQFNQHSRQKQNRQIQKQRTKNASVVSGCDCSAFFLSLLPFGY